MSTAATRDTLCGVATGTPDGGVAIVRVSGPKARSILERLIGGPAPPPRHLGARSLRLPDGALDSALVVLMPGPGSYTGEDVVELHVHAGERNVRAVTAAVLAAGARAAGPGEFSRRAFELGAMDLAEAEGVAAMIGARTDGALAQARRLVAGELGDTVAETRTGVLELRTEVEANLDFPDDVDPGDRRRWATEVERFRAEVERWLAGFEAGRRARERSRVVLAGPTNAGKSALFNALLGQRRAIVASEPGTTRDYVEHGWQLGSRELTLVDTAGRRVSENEVERAGVRLAADQAAGADILLWVIGSDQEDVVEPIHDDGAIVLYVENKRDLGTRRASFIGVSARAGTGLDELRARILDRLGGEAEAGWIGLARHRDRAADAVEALREAASLLGDDEALELVAFQLGVVEDRLGEIRGHTRLGPVGAEVLDRIFSRFCIGK